MSAYKMEAGIVAGYVRLVTDTYVRTHKYHKWTLLNNVLVCAYTGLSHSLAMQYLRVCRCI